MSMELPANGISAEDFIFLNHKGNKVSPLNLVFPIIGSQENGTCASEGYGFL